MVIRVVSRGVRRGARDAAQPGQPERTTGEVTKATTSEEATTPRLSDIEVRTGVVAVTFVCFFAMSEQGIDIRVLSPQQLQSLGQSLEGDIQALVDSMQALQQAAQRFQRSALALGELATQEEGERTEHQPSDCVCLAVFV